MDAVSQENVRRRGLAVVTQGFAKEVVDLKIRPLILDSPYLARKFYPLGGLAAAYIVPFRDTPPTGLFENDFPVPPTELWEGGMPTRRTNTCRVVVRTWLRCLASYKEPVNLHER